MKKQKNKKLTLDKQTITVLTKKQQSSLLGGNNNGNGTISSDPDQPHGPGTR
jgi:hypothetical protein